MFRLHNWILPIALMGVLSLHGQSTDALPQWQDRELTYSEFIALVRNYHPVARQASLLSDQAKARLRTARGFFDPVLYSDIDQKVFKEKDYYRLSESGLKIPTWFGLEGKVAFEWNDGEFMNPENSVPEDGLAVAGVSWDVGGGIFLDERRAALKQAKLFREANEARQVEFLNDLLLEANRAYWEWVAAYENAVVFDTALTLTRIRFDGVKESFKQGDKPAIDTLEAFIQVQNREISNFDAQRKLREKALKVSNFLWIEGRIPLQLEPDVVPQNFNEQMIDLSSLDTLNQQIQSLSESHPILRQFQLNVQQQQIEQRFKARKLVPTIKVNYNFLTEQSPFQGDPLNQTGFNTQDYKFGVDLKFPLLLREGRGAYQEARIKTENAQLKLDQKTVEILNKARAFQNELTYLHEQLLVYRQAVLNYRRMLEAEEIKFFNGESSIFLINSREVKLVEALVKLNKTEAAYEQAKAGLYHALGTLSQEL